MAKANDFDLHVEKDESGNVVSATIVKKPVPPDDAKKKQKENTEVQETHE